LAKGDSAGIQNNPHFLGKGRLGSVMVPFERAVFSIGSSL